MRYPRGTLDFPRCDVISGVRERASHRFDDTRLIGADNLYAALIRRYFQVTLRRRSYAERARDGARRVECNLAGNPWRCACTGYARTAAKRDCTTCRASELAGYVEKTAMSFAHISASPSLIDGYRPDRSASNHASRESYKSIKRINRFALTHRRQICVKFNTVISNGPHKFLC